MGSGSYGVFGSSCVAGLVGVGWSLCVVGRSLCGVGSVGHVQRR